MRKKELLKNSMWFGFYEHFCSSKISKIQIFLQNFLLFIK
jgi:hypothetical protein